ncbi:Zinc finger, RING-type [Phaffia rhodozyma]|uniref:Zinc finger, RING-type n=1 Tax=Phaffia rhodozyma TaxID=264483 RepID=A0A0F7SIA9_PHARH|nr:Zinc finger, RING-type [Phaffia rhodozyma]
MSNQKPEPNLLTFWNLVSCSVCRRSISDIGPTLSLWITSCGHILCDDHRDPRKRCAECQSENILLQPLPSADKPPDQFADFLGSIPTQTVMEAVEFQQRYLIDLVSYFKRKTISQKNVLSDVKTRLAAGMESLARNARLEQEILDLRAENRALLARLAHHSEHGNPRESMGPPRRPSSTYVSVHSSDESRKRRREGPSSESGNTVPSPHPYHQHMVPPRLTIPPSHRPGSSIPVMDTSQVRLSGRSSRPDRGEGALAIAPERIQRSKSTLGKLPYDPRSSRQLTATPLSDRSTPNHRYMPRTTPQPIHPDISNTTQYPGRPSSSASYRSQGSNSTLIRPMPLPSQTRPMPRVLHTTRPQSSAPTRPFPDPIIRASSVNSSRSPFYTQPPSTPRSWSSVHDK